MAAGGDADLAGVPESGERVELGGGTTGSGLLPVGHPPEVAGHVVTAQVVGRGEPVRGMKTMVQPEDWRKRRILLRWCGGS